MNVLFYLLVLLSNITINTDFKDFKKIYDKAIDNSVFEVKEKFENIEGSWNYEIKEGKIVSFYYDYSTTQATKENFDNCLNSVKSIIEKYTKQYGKAKWIVKGNQNYVSLKKQSYWGYDVIKALFENNNEKIEIYFDVIGKEGETNYIVKVEHLPIVKAENSVQLPVQNFIFGFYMNKITKDDVLLTKINIKDEKMESYLNKDYKVSNLKSTQIDELKKIIIKKNLFETVVIDNVCEKSKEVFNIELTLKIDNVEINSTINDCLENFDKNEYVKNLIKIVNVLEDVK